MRRHSRITGHCALPVKSQRLGQRTPFGIEVVGGLRRHPRREPLVQPQVVPPRHGNEVAEPLVRHFVSDDIEDVLLLALCRELGILQQDALEVENCAPIFHRTEELRRSRSSDHVELGKRIRRSKIVVVMRKDAFRARQRIVSLIDHALACDNTDLDVPRHDCLALDIAQAKEKQIARHLGGGRKVPHGLARDTRRLVGNRHVRKCRLAVGGDRAQLECRL